jgi:starch phosphorylase
MLEEYRVVFYEPAAALGVELAERQGQAARELYKWKRTLPERWKTLNIENVDIPDRGYIHVGEPIPVRLVLDCGLMHPDELLVQVYYGPLTAHGDFVQTRVTNLMLTSIIGTRAVFEGTYTTPDSGQHGVALRVLPHHPHVPDPVDIGLIVWV